MCAGLAADALAYVALHGTGTPLGDPIEVGALGQAAAVVKGSTEAAPRLTMASVKSCYGHTEGAAGITGMLLAVSALQQQVSIRTFRRTRHATGFSALKGPLVWRGQGHDSSLYARAAVGCFWTLKNLCVLPLPIASQSQSLRNPFQSHQMLAHSLW